ncbi:MAG: cyanophycinase [Pseudomonadota bacterium]
MMRIKAIFTFLLISLSPQAAMSEGRLIIAGGAVAKANAPVWEAFIESLPEEGHVFVVAAASSAPSSSAQSARSALASHGLAMERIKVAPLAVLDDKGTPSTNESKWRKNAFDSKLSNMLQEAAGFWFTGGDQLRITNLLQDGEEAPALTAIRRAHANGASLGGASAGAAIMSDLMIYGGESLSALLQPPTRSGGDGLLITQGLGFFTHGVVDQHFGERARLGRLIRAISILPQPEQRLGFGIDEGTALVVDAAGRLSVVGENYVTVVDGTTAAFSETKGRLSVNGLTLHLLGPTDALNLATGAVTPAAYRKATVTNPYFNTPLPGGGGMALNGQTLSSVIGDGLVDNAAASQIIRDSFDDKGRGARYRFTQRSNTRGFWGRNKNNVAHYSVISVKMDVIPIQVTIEELDH